MKILGMGVPELLIILAVVLLIFGPKHLPKLGAAVGSTVKNLREGLGGDKKIEDASDEIIEMEEDEEIEEEAPVKKTVKTTTAKKVATKKAAVVD
ncbi:twin-arginine translocase TatA/TatE family subunit [Raoultibacter phocaeensis]|uniref:twin-arginine translocase TatA/TatE family subunit n=1 Tax=Raoultibacter phocaeensis TaxID=2479841 RepID=UPI00111B450E|nr:twin-arginine translocase TatA/TatE family subunit [Raoultibacter phocaeensis]